MEFIYINIGIFIGLLNIGLAISIYKVWKRDKK